MIFLAIQTTWQEVGTAQALQLMKRASSVPNVEQSLGRGREVVYRKSTGIESAVLRDVWRFSGISALRLAGGDQGAAERLRASVNLADSSS